MNNKKSAFVVDDDPAYADTISLHLRKSGFDVKCFSSGGGAMHQLYSSPDLIVLDQNLGEQSGLQYLKKIRHKAPNVPVLFLSEKDDVNAASQALSFGASFYIEKNSAFMDKFPVALDYLDTEKKSWFANALKSFRKGIFSLYNF
jgi:DNA-binding response OmpR family regulator